MPAPERAAGLGPPGRLTAGEGTWEGEQTHPGKWICRHREHATPEMPAETLADGDRQARLRLPGLGRADQCRSVGFCPLVCLSPADGPFVCPALCLFVSLFARLSPSSHPSPAMCCLAVQTPLSVATLCLGHLFMERNGPWGLWYPWAFPSSS